MAYVTMADLYGTGFATSTKSTGTAVSSTPISKTASSPFSSAVSQTGTSVGAPTGPAGTLTQPQQQVSSSQPWMNLFGELIGAGATVGGAYLASEAQRDIAKEQARALRLQPPPPMPQMQMPYSGAPQQYAPQQYAPQQYAPQQYASRPAPAIPQAVWIGAGVLGLMGLLGLGAVIALK